MKKKINDWIDKKWKDPVWSKVIANIIWYGPVVFIGGAILKIWESVDINSFIKFKDFILSCLNYKLSFSITDFLVGLLLIIGIIWIYRKIIRLIRRRANEMDNAILNEVIGDYTFREIYEKLANERLLEKTQKMRDYQVGPPNASLLELFGSYRQTFNDGLKNSVEKIIGYRTYEEDGGYLIDVVAPKLLSYKLLNKIEEQGFVINHTVLFITYETSQEGYKFFDCWDRLSDLQRGR